MCGRFFLNSPPTVIDAEFSDYVLGNTFPADASKRYNIAPTQPIAVIPNYKEPSYDAFLWGLIPSWSKETKIASKLINARSETVHEKPSFRAAFKRRRCLVLADGFFEWMKLPDKKKQPYAIRMESQAPFAFAGIWENWSSPEGDLIKTCSILTTRPNEKLKQIHDRMPVILNPDDYKLWLTTDEIKREDVQHIFEPYPQEEFITYPISKDVGSPANDHPGIIESIEL